MPADRLPLMGMNAYRIVDENGKTAWVGRCWKCVKMILAERPDWRLA